MKKIIIVVLFFSSVSLLSMEQESRQSTQQSVQQEEGPTNRLERLSANVSINPDTNVYYVDGCGPVPKAMLCSVLVCQSLRSCTSHDLDELDKRDRCYHASCLLLNSCQLSLCFVACIVPFL